MSEEGALGGKLSISKLSEEKEEEGATLHVRTRLRVL